MTLHTYVPAAFSTLASDFYGYQDMLADRETNATAHMRETVGRCREALGSNGIPLNYGVARHMGEAEAIHSYEGTLALIVGRSTTGEATCA